MTYRNEIDGLRAIAVLAVLIYHLGVSGFGGGFVGVDIFFVISGYVIFRSIKAQLITGSFRAGQFIKRRIYRLQPALFVTLLVSAAFAYRILGPTELERFGLSLLAAGFGLSNFYFSDNAGNYFAALAESQPLLHTWSLGVEEQFYLLAMGLFVFASRRQSTAQLTLPLIALCLLSFAFNLFDIYGSGKTNRAFYFPLHRFWELGCGALLALHEPAKKPVLLNRNLLPGLALAGVLWSVFWVENDARFPGVIALLPVLSTALLILTLSKGNWVYAWLASAPMTGIGKISYSLYLVHWPIIVLTRLALGRELGATDQAIIFASSLAAAVLLWHWVEVPLRMKGRHATPPHTQWLLIPALLVLCSAGTLFIVSKGLPNRLEPAALAVLAASQDADSACPASSHWRQPKAAICGNFEADQPIDVLVWGDSHAGALKAGLYPQLMQAQLTSAFVTMPDCPPLIGIYTSRLKNREECRALAEALMARIARGQIRVLVLASRWANLESPVPSPGDGGKAKTLYHSASGEPIRFQAALLNTVRQLRALGARLVLVGPVPEINFDVPQTLVRASINDFALPTVSLADFLHRQSAVLPALAQAADEGAQLFLPHQLLCDQSQCRVQENQLPLYLDDDHLSPLGAAGVARPLMAVLQAQLVDNAE